MSETTETKLFLPVPIRRMAAVKAAWKPILLNWVLPGAGYWVLGKKDRAKVLFGVWALFLLLAFLQLRAGAAGGVKGGVYVPQLAPLQWMPTLGALATLGVGPVYALFAGLFGGMGAEPVRNLTQEYGASYVMVAGLLNWLATFDLWDRATHRWWWRLPKDEQEELSKGFEAAQKD